MSTANDINRRARGIVRAAVPLSIVAGCLVAAAFMLCAGSAFASDACFDPAGTNSQPGFGVATGCFDGLASADASSTTASFQAGGVPYALSTTMEFNTVEKEPADEGIVRWPTQPVKDVFVDTPPGLIGNPTVLKQCTMDQLAYDHINTSAQGPLCPPESQVGTAEVRFADVSTAVPLFNMVPPPGTPARFGFNIEGVVIVLDARLRSDGDYGISVDSREISATLALIGTEPTFWGVPADPSHDAERACPGEPNPVALGGSGPFCATKVAPIRFLRQPTSCTAPGHGLSWMLHTDSWWNPGAQTIGGIPVLSDPNWKSASYVTHQPPGLAQELEPDEWGEEVGITECEALPFEANIDARPTTHEADSPTGLNVDLTIPQDALEEPSEALPSADLQKAVITLPKGMSVNPASAGGLASCAPDQIGLTTPVGASPVHFDQREPNCPDSSKIGSAEIHTPLLEHPLKGSVYLAAQGQNPFGSLLAIYIAIVDPQSGVIIKQAGHVIPGPEGQLTTIVEDIPQLPFSDFHLEFFGGPRASLLTPLRCGAYATRSELTPWSGTASVEVSSSFQVTGGPHGGGCPPPAFEPKLTAGTESPTAGSFTPFNLKLTREDGTQQLGGLALTLPSGLVGKLAGVTYCPDAALASIPTAEGTAATQLASPTCPASSQVGTVTVGAGAGSDPFYLSTGRVYLAGPYKGAPLSLAIATPVVAGPFDLGNVLVRAALQVNPETAQITAVSDPLPTSLFGIPLDLRDVRVNMNRPGFTLNPTNCNPMAVSGTVDGIEGATAAVSNRFQVGGCNVLAFKPKLVLGLKGKTNRGAHPRFKAVLRMKEGGANIARAAVTLPPSEILDQSHIKTICTRVQFAANACPPGSVYGYAKAFTPLLDQPLEGRVYLRSSSHNLPDLVADLNGQIHVDLAGRIDSVHGGIRNIFEVVPDAPVTKFILVMHGGHKGLLQNSTNICAKANRAVVRFDGQNGKTHDIRPVLRDSKCKKGSEKHQTTVHRR